MNEFVNFLISIFNLGQNEAQYLAKRIINGTRQIFFISLGLSLVFMLIGFSLNDAGIDGKWLIVTSSIMSFVTMIIALFVFMGPGWAILLILPNSSAETKEFWEKYILPIILWISFANMAFLLFPVTNWGLKDATVFIFAVITAILVTVVLEKTVEMTYQIIFVATIVIIVALIAKLFFPTIVGNVIDHLFYPTHSYVVSLTQTWWGALLILIGFIWTIPKFIKLVKKINGDISSHKITSPPKKPKKKINIGEVIKNIGSAIITFAFWLGFFYIIWWAVDKEYPDLTNKATQVVAQGWEKGKKAVGQIQIPTQKTPVTTMPQPQPKSATGWNPKHKQQVIFQTGKDKLFNPGYTLSFNQPVQISYDQKKWVLIKNNQEITNKQKLYVRKGEKNKLILFYKK